MPEFDERWCELGAADKLDEWLLRLSIGALDTPNAARETARTIAVGNFMVQARRRK